AGPRGWAGLLSRCGACRVRHHPGAALPVAALSRFRSADGAPRELASASYAGPPGLSAESSAVATPAGVHRLGQWRLREPVARTRSRASPPHPGLPRAGRARYAVAMAESRPNPDPAPVSVRAAWKLRRSH